MATIYFSGIGGIGMSALARALKTQGHHILGSDAVDAPLLAELEIDGITVFREQRANQIPDDCTELIYSEAVPLDHPERFAAQARRIPEQSYFEKLGAISRDFFTICIAGTHGKSGTTVMAALALEAQGVKPNVLVGTKVFEWGGRNFRAGNSNVLVVEACEYRESFLHLAPDVIILTNVEPDHLDYYGTAEKYFRGFQEFVAKLPADGVLIADFHAAHIAEITTQFSGKKIAAREFLPDVPELRVKGEHYRENASKVLALFAALELDSQIAQKSLAAYRGAWRRFEIKGERSGVTVIDDYGHHPTEIRATMQTLSEAYPQRKKWVVFQPHQYSRTADFLIEFAQSFTAADEILIPNIYRVRDSEVDLARVSPEMLVKEIRKHLGVNQSVRYTEDFERTVKLLRHETKPGDIVLTIGAGPVNEVGEKFLAAEVRLF